MFSTAASAALLTLANASADSDDVDLALRERWRGTKTAGEWLDAELVAAAETFAEAMELHANDAAAADLLPLFDGVGARVASTWCFANTWRRDLALAPLFYALRDGGHEALAIELGRARVVEGPIGDALACAPLLDGGDAAPLHAAVNAEARARLQILFWEAGASAREVPELGAWIFGSRATFEEMVRKPARGTLRGRVLAARCLEVTAAGIGAAKDPEIVGQTLQVLQPLLFHPEPLVWIHAARALGRLAGPVEELQGTLLDWVQGDSRILRQRAITAFASLPADRFSLLAGYLLTIIKSRDEDALTLAAVAAATPYLFFERRDMWDRLATRIIAGDGGAISARALARGLATIWRRGMAHDGIEPKMRALRELARKARPASGEDARRFLEVISATDVVDGAERDPLDLELGLENLARIAAQYDDEEADARAARFAGSVASTFREAQRIVLGTSSVRHRAAATNALESCARAFALRLWVPLLATGRGEGPVDEPDLKESWEQIARAPSELLDVVKEMRHGRDASGEGVRDLSPELPLEVLAIRLGGYALDACGEDADLGPGRGQTAHDTCLWLRKIEGLADGSRELPASLAGALSMMFWRLVDTTRGTALGEVDDVEWLGPFAAWWALVIDRPTVLLQLAAALPMMSEEALATCCRHAETLRACIGSGAADGAWVGEAKDAFAALHAAETELGDATLDLARELEFFGGVGGRNADLDARCLDLVFAADRLHQALANPVKALHRSEEAAFESIPRARIENARRTSTLVGRAIRARDASLLDVWFASLGPVVSGLLEVTIRGAIGRTPPPPPPPKKKEPDEIAGYELVKPLGEGGIGKVWLVRKPGADRFFVLKIPKADALESANEAERAAILASFVEEAKALAGLYHPNVANIIDRGVVDDVPYMVLEYLIGADLSQYAAAQRMSLFELRQVVLDTCAGLSALHGVGLVHRDLKPPNLWLRLPLAGGERFDPQKHRNPAHTAPLSTVVIDFGMVRAIRVNAEVGGRFVAGTPGYIAPEQVLDPVELDPRADLYSLAGTICNVTTGRSFFDELTSPRDRLIAHLQRDPLEDAERLRGFPAPVAKLLRAAVTKEPKDRPTAMEFARAFAAAL